MTIDKTNRYVESYEAVYNFLLTLGFEVVPLNYDEIGSSETPLPYIAYDVDLTTKSNTLKYAPLPEGVITVMCINEDKATAIAMADLVENGMDNVALDFSIKNVDITEDYIRDGIKAYFVKLRYQVSFDGTR